MGGDISGPLQSEGPELSNLPARALESRNRSRMEEREMVVSGFEGDGVRKMRVSWTEQVRNPIEVQSAELIEVMLVLFASLDLHCVWIFTRLQLFACVFFNISSFNHVFTHQKECRILCFCFLFFYSPTFSNPNNIFYFLFYVECKRTIIGLTRHFMQF